MRQWYIRQCRQWTCFSYLSQQIVIETKCLKECKEMC